MDLQILIKSHAAGKVAQEQLLAKGYRWVNSSAETLEAPLPYRILIRESGEISWVMSASGEKVINLEELVGLPDWTQPAPKTLEIDSRDTEVPWSFSVQDGSVRAGCQVISYSEWKLFWVNVLDAREEVKEMGSLDKEFFIRVPTVELQKIVGTKLNEMGFITPHYIFGENTGEFGVQRGSKNVGYNSSGSNGWFKSGGFEEVQIADLFCDPSTVIETPFEDHPRATVTQTGLAIASRTVTWDVWDEIGGKINEFIQANS